jgi:penicillin-binding protein 1A
LAQDRSSTCDVGPWQLAEGNAVVGLPLAPQSVDEHNPRGHALAGIGRAAVHVVGMSVRALARGLRYVLLAVAHAALRAWRYRTVRVALASACVFVLTTTSALAYRIYFDRRDLPDLEAFIRFEPPSTGVIYEAHGGSLIEVAHEYRRVVSYEQVPEVLRQAVLAAEDKSFFAHNGVAYGALPRIAWKSVRDSIGAWRRGGEAARVRLPQGGSTLTQQLVRGYFLQGLASRENGQSLLPTSVVARVLAAAIGVPATNKLARKLEEVRLSLWLESELGRRFGSKERAKREIFARYASFLYLGNGRYGFAAASDYYLGKPLASYGPADAADAALLAGIGKSPREYAPEPGNLPALRRRNRILALMARDGYVPLSLAESCQKEPLRVVARSPIKTHAPAAVETVLDELKRFGGPSFGAEDLFMGRIAVHSTVDARIQALVNAALEQGLEAYEKRHPRSKGLIQGSVVVLRNADGGILAEAGGRQLYKERSTLYGDFNRARQSLRQPGSAMKPLVYLAALQHGLALDTLVPDMPVAVPLGGNRGLKWISNYDDRFKGMIPLREALAESRNSVAIWIALQVGMPSVLKLAREMGIRTPLQPYVTTALGASEVNLLELAGVYRTMASGIVAEPHVIARIDGPGGELLYSATPPRASASTDALRAIQEGLRGVVRLPGGTAHSLDTPGFPAVMGKTGTSSDFRDALFVGSTYGALGITVAVRVGFDDNRALGDRETGGRAALPVFRQIVQGVYEQQWLGAAPKFPREIEAGIDGYLMVRAAAVPALTAVVAPTEVTVPVSVVGPATSAVVAAALDPQVQPAR